MEFTQQSGFQRKLGIAVHTTEAGLLAYIIDSPPEALPSVARDDLIVAWRAARAAALAQSSGLPRGLHFCRQDGSVFRLVLADADACCWAAAVDRLAGLHTPYGLTLCLRLLGLVDLLASARWAGCFFDLAPDGVTLHPDLLAAAAALPLNAEARFDEALFRARLLPRIGSRSFHPQSRAFA
ncbi:MAG: hypothetical protein K6U10_14355 [Acidobacteriia bacterium]|nr:hypothetical protein [Methyloceanibacter sp.]MCL6492984.1 hypothetical protein [Terriglobia bacterium]